MTQRPGARAPVELSFLQTPSVHELDLVVRPDGRALALLATPFTEFADTYRSPTGGSSRTRTC